MGVHQIERPALALDAACDAGHAPRLVHQPSVRDAIAPGDRLERVDDVVRRLGAHGVLGGFPPSQQHFERDNRLLERDVESAPRHREDVHLDRRCVFRQELGLLGEEDP